MYVVKRVFTDDWKRRLISSFLVTLLLSIIWFVSLSLAWLPGHFITDMVRAMLGWFLIVYLLTYIEPITWRSWRLWSGFIPGVVGLAFYTYVYVALLSNSQTAELYTTELYTTYYKLAVYLALFTYSLKILNSCWSLSSWLIRLSKVFLSLVSFIYMVTSASYAVYVMIYHDVFSEVAFLSIALTTPEEATGYMQSMFTPLMLLGLALAIIFFAALSWLVAWVYPKTYLGRESKTNYIEAACTDTNDSLIGEKRLRRKEGVVASPKKVTVKRVLAIFLFIAMILILRGKFIKFFPVHEYYICFIEANGPMQVFERINKTIPVNAATIHITSKETLAQTLPGTVIVVVGESAARDHMSAFTPLYPFQTTPWQSQIEKSSSFIFFPKAYSNYPNTVMALTQALTSANQYNKEALEHSVDIMSLAKKAGYHTYWFSTQGKNGMYDAGVTTIAKQATIAKWIDANRVLDGDILAQLKTVPKEQTNFIVIHLMGSHAEYKRRTSDAFKKAHPLAEDKTAAEYDQSILYTDTVLQEIYTYARQNLDLQAMVYFSDHGEDLQYKHTTGPFKYDMVRIPFWIYLSTAYQKTYPQYVSELRANRMDIFTNDLIFDTVSGLLQAPNNYYSSVYDIGRKQYSLTLQNAKTIRGSRWIKDDPLLNHSQY